MAFVARTVTSYQWDNVSDWSNNAEGMQILHFRIAKMIVKVQEYIFTMNYNRYFFKLFPREKNNKINKLKKKESIPFF